MMIHLIFFFEIHLLLFPSFAAPPNIIFVLTDDQDLTMKSMSYLPQLLSLFQQNGTEMTNMFVHTPVCCPSRSTFHTGKFLHNNGVKNNSLEGNCSSTVWQNTNEKQTLAVYMKNGGYRTGYFGKYLNNYGFAEVGGPAHIPPGWDEWQGLVGNSVYYNYTISNNGVGEAHGDNYATDYLTDLLANRSINFINQSDSRPFFAWISTPACHQPADPAPQYANLLAGIQSPRTEDWNTITKDKHWFVGHAGVFGPMNSSVVEFSDLLYRRRLLTLMSVQDLVMRVVNLLTNLGQLENTYLIYTGDHGYHLGQFGLGLDKRLPYDFDIRVPFYVMGPDVPKGGRSSAVISSVDLAPTILDMAGLPAVPTMDGKSFLPVLRGQVKDANFRDEILLEYFGEQNLDVASGVCPQLPGVEGFVNGPGVTLTPPMYTGPSFCSCQDASNNTYHCLRIFNATNNQLYCEFVDGYLEFFDLNYDFYEMQNLAPFKTPNELAPYHAKLEQLLHCQGEDCSNVTLRDMK